MAEGAARPPLHSLGAPTIPASVDAAATEPAEETRYTLMLAAAGPMFAASAMLRVPESHAAPIARTVAARLVSGLVVSAVVHAIHSRTFRLHLKLPPISKQLSRR